MANIFGNQTWRYVKFYWKKTFFFNYGLCCPFSEKRYICFLVNILAVLLMLFIPNLVRKCQIMCSRIWVEEIVFLKFFGIASKENKFLLVTIATVLKENFPQFISKYFLCWCYFCKQKLSQRLPTWDMFSRRFSIVCIAMATGSSIWAYTTFFMVLWISDLYLYTDKYSRLHCFICPKYTVLRKGVLLWNPHM